MPPNQTITREKSAPPRNYIDKPGSDPYEIRPGEKPYKLEIVWRNVLLFIILHLMAAYGFYIKAKAGTWVIAIIWALTGSWGIAAGAHRLWCHKSYRANKKMKAMLLLFQTIALQNSVIEWVRDHRVHHKFSDTNADPHNIRRGFFFAHIGWLMCKKHPDVVKYGKRVDLSDLTSDPILRFQHKFYPVIVPFACFLFPMALSVVLFDENFWTSLFVNMARYMFTLHITWSINSVSHIWGAKPFEKDICPTDTFIIGFLAFGEGWHNYHHVFPYDYKVSELPTYYCNFTIPFIDFFAYIGWATDLKTVSDEMIRKRVLRTGDGSHRYAKTYNTEVKPSEARDVDHFWGYDDKDMLNEDKENIQILYRKFDN